MNKGQAYRLENIFSIIIMTMIDFTLIRTGKFTSSVADINNQALKKNIINKDIHIILHRYYLFDFF